MQTRFAFLFAILAAALGPVPERELAAQEVAPAAQNGEARETGNGTGNGNGRWVQFTDEEMARFRATAEELSAKRETYIHVSADDETIVLEPYVVQGDGSQVIARMRRDLEQAYRPRRLGMSAADRVAMLMARRVDDEFFGTGGPHAVLRSRTAGRSVWEAYDSRADATMLQLNPLALVDTFRRGNFSNVFAAPPE